MEEFLGIVQRFPIALLLLFVVMRLMGRKGLKQATPLDYAFVVGSMSIAWDMTIGGFKLWQMLCVMLILCVMIYIFDKLTAKNRKLEKALIGEPILLVKNGKILQDALERERMSVHELESKLRLKGVFCIEKIERAYMEMGGEISIKMKS